MNWNWKEYNQQKHQFKSYYCGNCKQAKPCRLLTQSICCSCAYQGDWQDYQAEQEQAQEYSDYQVVYQKKVKERQEQFHQLQLLKSYQGCSKCGSKEVDACSLYDKNKLDCQPCLMRKEGGASGAISFSVKGKWYKKYWEIDLTEWLTKFQCLPVNADCARKWLKNKEHLSNCACLEQEIQQARQRAEEWVKDLTNSLREKQELLKKCCCKVSEKVRVTDDDYAWCDKCGESVSVASKKRVIKNRNNPSFWGLNIKEKVLCGKCLESKKEKMPPLRKAEFNRYRKTGRL